MSGLACTPDDLAHAVSAHATLNCFTYAERTGLAFGAGAGVLSLLSVIVFFGLIIRNVVRARRQPGAHRRALIEKPLEIYLLSLFIAEFIHGVGVTLEFKWIIDDRVSSGGLCSAQGLLMNIGSVTIALYTLVIAWYTFIAVWWSKRMTSLVTPTICSIALWLYAFVYATVFISSQKNPLHRYYLPTPYWCWISHYFTYNRAAGEWFWLWFALFFCLLFCVLLFIRGRKSILNNLWNENNILHGMQSPVPTSTKRVSYRMLLYAVSYCILVLPMSVVRWIQYALEAKGKVSNVPAVATITAFSIFNLTGIVNVALFFLTRPPLLLFDSNSPLSAGPRSARAFMEVRPCDTLDVSVDGRRRHSGEHVTWADREAG